VDAAAIPAPLGGLTGDPAQGPALAAAHCAACHVLPSGADDAENGLVLSAARLGEGGLRLAIVNLGIVDPARADHAFYDLPGFDPEAEAPPATLLTAAEVEALVAWLTGLAR
jgi:mono/diheme cytochrome c family protein